MRKLDSNQDKELVFAIETKPLMKFSQVAILIVDFAHYSQIEFSSQPLVKPIIKIGIFGYESNRFLMSCLIVFSGLIALHK